MRAESFFRKAACLHGAACKLYDSGYSKFSEALSVGIYRYGSNCSSNQAQHINWIGTVAAVSATKLSTESDSPASAQ